VIFILIIWFILGRGFEEVKKGESLEIPLKQIFRRLVSLKKVWLVAILTSAYFFSAYGLGQWLPTLLESSGMSSTEAGLIASIPSWTGVLGCVVIPRYAKSGRRMPMIAGLILIQGLMVYSVTITSGLILTLGLIILGICTHSVLPILMIILMDIPEISSEYMGFASGVLFSIGCVFGVVSPLIVGYIADFTGSLVPSIVFLAVLIEFVLIFTVIMKE
jgi:CP family cyanate transporter-like MFS transporter